MSSQVSSGYIPVQVRKLIFEKRHQIKSVNAGLPVDMSHLTDIDESIKFEDFLWSSCVDIIATLQVLSDCI